LCACSKNLCCSKLTPTHRFAQVGMLALFAGEVYAWFVVGEIVGRGGSLVDYDV
jgi:Mitochondrial ATP synthase g subunit